MDPGGSEQDGGVVNMTRATEALSPWLNHPRKTIVQVEGLVLAAAVLLLLQLILGSCRRRWHNSFIKYGLQVCNGIMFPLTVYTLGTMQSSPIKNSLYAVWAGFLIMASAGTTAVQQYDFYENKYKKYIQFFVEWCRDFFYVVMFLLLMEPDGFTMKMKIAMTKARPTSLWVRALVLVIFMTKLIERLFSVSVYTMQGSRLSVTKKKTRHTQEHGAKEESGNDGANYSDPQNMNGCKYAVVVDPTRSITIDQIWDCCVINSSYGTALKELCLSYALSQRLLRQRYFGMVYVQAGLLKDHDFVFKKLLPPQGDFKRAFRIIEVELGFCYDFFFTKYYCTFFTWMLFPMPFVECLVLVKKLLLLVVGVIAIRKSLVLETPNPIIEVHISKGDYIINLLVLSIALLVELVQAAFYLASNWAQVSLACMIVKKRWFEPNANISGKIIGLLRWATICQQLKDKIDQHSVIFPLKQQPDAVEVSDAVKTVIATSLRSTYANNLTTNEEASVRLRKQILGGYSWAQNNLSQLEVIFIWHIATEYCNAISIDPSNGTTPRSSSHRGGHLFSYVLQWLRPDPRRNMIASDAGVAVHLSRYYLYLIGSVPELLPYHEADIEELAQEVMEERNELFESCHGLPEIYNEMESLAGRQEEDDPTTLFKKGLKLGKQLQGKTNRWEVLQDFWAKKIIQAAASHYTTKQHMQHLEDGGEFLTHIWALLAHAGILNLNRSKDQEGRMVRIPAPDVELMQEANLRSAPSQAETLIHVNGRGAFSSPL